MDEKGRVNHHLVIKVHNKLRAYIVVVNRISAFLRCRIFVQPTNRYGSDGDSMRFAKCSIDEIWR